MYPSGYSKDHTYTMSNMNIELKKYVRNPLTVEAIQLTEANFLNVALWCGGRICDKHTEKPTDGIVDPDNQYISIKTHNPINQKQSRAVVGDWILYTARGYKIYPNRAFKANFQLERRAEQGQKEASTKPTPIEQTLINAAKEADEELERQREAIPPGFKTLGEIKDSRAELEAAENEGLPISRIG